MKAGNLGVGARAAILVLAAGLIFAAAAYWGGPDAHGRGSAYEEGEGPELAPYMGDMQRLSQKLGYSIQARNGPLAAFYIDEIEEGLEQIEDRFPVWEDYPLPKLVRIIAEPAVGRLRDEIAARHWEEVDAAYAALVQSCNRCHASTEHEFLVITAPRGEPPFNQRFESP